MADSTPQRRVEVLFQEALGIPPEEREAFLVSSCGADDQLLETVRSLLAEDAKATLGILRGDPLRASDSQDSGEERIGRYRLLRVLGEGGMGTVYLAEQEKPVRRLVALKTIRLGGLSKDATKRFAAECQALADMSHPGIARVFDGGQTASGLPYLVMEYAPGLSLIEHCDRYRTRIQGRLELLAEVCDAVQHAHQKGVVHRDLKPGNILVDVQQGTAHPRVVDFGIARALSGQLTSETLPLADHLGTPAYMSPARLGARDSGVDTRDDVYSLGVILYQLLTGSLPFEPSSRIELIRALKEDPPTPSASLVSLGAELEEVARERSTKPLRLLRQVRGDLDAIALCALARDPTRRYASAAEMGEDMRRFLHHRALSAVPPTTSYRTRRFLRRHWLGAALGIALFLSLALGIVGTLIGLRDARAGRSEALRRQAAERKEREESDLLVRAFQEALWLAKAGEATDETLSVDEVMVVLADQIDSLGKRTPGAEAALRCALGRCFLAIGADKEAHDQFLLAYSVGGTTLDDDPLDRFDVLEGLIQSTRRTGNLAGAQTYVAQAVEVARAVFQDGGGDLFEGLETLIDIAAGGEANGEAAVPALKIVLASKPNEVVRGDQSGVAARILIEAATQLRERDSPETGEFLTTLEEGARRILSPEDVRRIAFLWQVAHVRLLPGAPPDTEALVPLERLLQESTKRLPRGHWLRSDAHRLLGRALLGQADFGRAEAELLAAANEALAGKGATRRRFFLALEALDDLAEALNDQTDPAGLEGFLSRSWAAHQAAPGSLHSTWWPAVKTHLPGRIRDTALAWLADRAEPGARTQRGMVLAQALRFDEALEELQSTAGDDTEPIMATALRSLSLARLERFPEARAEYTRLIRRRQSFGKSAPELDQVVERLREEIGL